MGKKLLLTLVMLVAGVLFLPGSASAHELISDETGALGAVLHIAPEDDPVAGKQSDLYLELQDQSLGGLSADLTVTNTADGHAVKVPVQVDGSTVVAHYTFPDKGSYALDYVVHADKAYVFKHVQQVFADASGSTAGKKVSATDASAKAQPNHTLARVLLVVCGVAFLVLLVVVSNRWDKIMKRSKF